MLFEPPADRAWAARSTLDVETVPHFGIVETAIIFPMFPPDVPSQYPLPEFPPSAQCSRVYLGQFSSARCRGGTCLHLPTRSAACFCLRPSARSGPPPRGAETDNAGVLGVLGCGPTAAATSEFQAPRVALAGTATPDVCAAVWSGGFLVPIRLRWAVLETNNEIGTTLSPTNLACNLERGRRWSSLVGRPGYECDSHAVESWRPSWGRPQ